MIVNLLGTSLVGSKEGEAMLSSLFHVSGKLCSFLAISPLAREMNFNDIDIDFIDSAHNEP